MMIYPLAAIRKGAADGWGTLGWIGGSGAGCCRHWYINLSVVERVAGFGENHDTGEPGRIGGDLGGRYLLAFVLLLGSSGLAAAKDIALIANKSNHLVAVTQPELLRICKGQTSHWPDGKPASLVIRDPSSPEMRLVLEKVYGLSKEEVAELIATANHNRVNHPAIVVADSDQDLVKKVESTPGAVGLVDVYAITGSVTVVRVGGKLPLEPGYLLHGN